MKNRWAEIFKFLRQNNLGYVDYRTSYSHELQEKAQKIADEHKTKTDFLKLGDNVINIDGNLEDLLR